MWRLKWRPEHAGGGGGGEEELYIGAASMHAGSGIYKIDLSSPSNAFKVTAEATQVDLNADRLVYGMDWLLPRLDAPPDRETDSSATSVDSFNFEIATCSFYDNLVQIWNC